MYLQIAQSLPNPVLGGLFVRWCPSLLGGCFSSCEDQLSVGGKVAEKTVNNLFSRNFSDFSVWKQVIYMWDVQAQGPENAVLAQTAPDHCSWASGEWLAT